MEKEHTPVAGVGRTAIYTIRGLPMSVEDRNYVLHRLFNHLDWCQIAHGPDFRVVHVRWADGDPVNWGYAQERGLKVEEGQPEGGTYF